MSISNANGRWNNADRDPIILSEPDPDWPARFETEAALLRKAIPPGIVKDIVHVGSTAIPGLPAKPVIDMLLIPGADYRKPLLVEALRGIGYVYWNANPRRDRVFLVKGMPPFGEGRTHHAHVRPAHESLDMVMFRDHLIAHPGRAMEYGCLKRSLAARFPTDREAYTRAKDEFVRKILQVARDRPDLA